MRLDIGASFGRLCVTEIIGRRREPNGAMTQWVACKCVCGSVREIRTASLTSGKTQSCGCLHRERISTHGMTKTPTYKIWVNMRYRCNNPNHSKYKLYGGRGIQVCERWENSFEAFLADMGPRPSLKHSIDRYPDMNGNYEPGNCRWATDVEQNNNRRDCRAAA